MACRLLGATPSLEPIVDYCQLDPWEQISVNSNRNSIIFIQENAFENIVCQNGSHFVQGEIWVKSTKIMIPLLQFNRQPPQNNISLQFADELFHMRI